uniref:Uncharacterized protein n=1 Tax=viral metagenome TaxID=1070528 RepID=A0A6M3Y5S3_9ZZZZ
MLDWHYCPKCKEVVKSCEHDPIYTIKSQANTKDEPELLPQKGGE